MVSIRFLRLLKKPLCKNRQIITPVVPGMTPFGLQVFVLHAHTVHFIPESLVAIQDHFHVCIPDSHPVQLIPVIQLGF